MTEYPVDSVISITDNNWADSYLICEETKRISDI